MTIEELKNNGWKDENGNLWNDPNENEWITYLITEVEVKNRIYKVPSWFINSIDNESDFLGSSNEVSKFLNKFGRTLEEYYSRFILNISEVPKCENDLCNNLVHVKDGALYKNLTKCCCRSCHISKRNKKLWRDPKYIMNSPEFKEKKSIEMKTNLSNWNYNSEFQARCKKGKVLSHKGVMYVFYIARTSSGFLKFGVAQRGSLNWRLFIQKEWNKDEYVSIHSIFELDNVKMANFEYELKSKFEFREYLNWSEFNRLKIEIKSIILKYK